MAWLIGAVCGKFDVLIADVLEQPAGYLPYPLLVIHHQYPGLARGFNCLFFIPFGG